MSTRTPHLLSRAGRVLITLTLLFVVNTTRAAWPLPQFEAVSVATGSTFASATFDNVSLQAEHTVAPVIIPVPNQSGGDPCNMRVRNVTASAFEMQCLEPTGNDGPHVGMDIHYIAMEPGVHTVPLSGGGSVTIEAACVSTAAVQHNCGAGCGAESWEAVGFSHTFTTPPVVLHNINTMNSETGAPPGGPTVPQLSTVIQTGSITTSGFNVALERSQSSPGSVVAEQVCYIAMEPVGCATLDFGGGETVDFVAGNTDVDIDGWDDGCDAGESASFGTCFTSAPVVVASKNTNNDADGGWPRRCSLSATDARFTIDEDRTTDTERNHGAEGLGYMAFAGDFATTPVTLSRVHSLQDGDDLVVNWTTSTEVGNVAFRIFGQIDGTWRRLNKRPIPSKVTSSSKPTRYSARYPGIRANSIRIMDIDVSRKREVHGPFHVGRVYGNETEVQRVKWAA